MQSLVADRSDDSRPAMQARLILAVLVLGSAAVGFLMLTEGHNWGDDFAAYILQAQSIVNGELEDVFRRGAFTAETSSFAPGFAIYPWGFPLLLAPVFALAGLNLLAFKMVLTLCYAAFLIPFFLLARSRLTDAESLLLTAFMAFNFRMLSSQNEILADIPFLLWSTLAIWLVDVGAGRKDNARGRAALAVTTGILVFMAALTRFNGLLLLAPLAVSQVMQFRSTPRQGRLAPREVFQAVLPYFVVVVGYAVQALLLHNSSIGLRDQWGQETLSWAGIWSNLRYYSRLPGEFLRDSGLGGDALYAVMALGFGVAAVLRRRQNAPILSYILVTFALFVIYPPRQGDRFLYPILPLFFLLSFQGMWVAVEKLRGEARALVSILVYVFWAGLTLVTLAASLGAARTNLIQGRQEQSGPFTAGTLPMFSFIRDTTTADSIIIFFKPRLMRLLTDRDAFRTTRCEDLLLGDYVVLSREDRTENQVPLSRIEGCASAVSLTRVFDEGDFVVLQISPPLP